MGLAGPLGLGSVSTDHPIPQSFDRLPPRQVTNCGERVSTPNPSRMRIAPACRVCSTSRDEHFLSHPPTFPFPEWTRIEKGGMATRSHYRQASSNAPSASASTSNNVYVYARINRDFRLTCTSIDPNLSLKTGFSP